MGARRRGGSRTGTFLVLVGIAGVLSATFVVGVWTGHNWPVLFGHANKIPATEPAAGRRGVAERPKAAETLPALTFYDELKAPLTAPPPPPPRTTKPSRRAAVPTEPPAAAAEGSTTRTELTPPRVDAPAAHAEPAPATPNDGGARFTVQVAAYNARPPADALRATLTAAGHDARVVEAATASGMKYRVQVGAFPTRPAAQDAAARLSAERSLAVFVTTR